MSLFEGIIAKSKTIFEVRESLVLQAKVAMQVIESFNNLRDTVREFVGSINQLTQACYSISAEQSAQRKLIEELTDRYLELMRILNDGKSAEDDVKKDTSN